MKLNNGAFSTLNLFILFSINCFVCFGGEIKKDGITFEQAGRAAIEASQELRTQKSKLRIAEKTWALGIREYLPKISFSTAKDDLISNISSDSFQKNLSINLEQLLWDGGRMKSARSIEKAKTLFEWEQIKNMEKAVMEQAKSAYRNILYMREVLKIQKSAFNTLLEQKTLLETEFILGMVVEFELKEAELTVMEKKMEILSLEMDLEESEIQFAESLGITKIPLLTEKIDINRGCRLISVDEATKTALQNNIELKSLKLSISQKQEEFKYASLSWIPSIRGSGSFSFSGRKFPLSTFSWSAGIIIEISTPWVATGFSGSTGFSGRHERSSNIRNTTSPVPSPVDSMTKHSTSLALSFEQENYRLVEDRLVRQCSNTVEKYRISDRKRMLSIEAMRLAGERFKLDGVKHDLGQITRLELMESGIKLAEKEIDCIKAAVAFLSAESELENLLNIPEGGLLRFSSINTFMEDTL
jgi:outer membrane protein TolC